MLPNLLCLSPLSTVLMVFLQTENFASFTRRTTSLWLSRGATSHHEDGSGLRADHFGGDPPASPYPSSVDSDHSGIRPPTHGPAGFLEASNILAHPQAADADRTRKVCNPMARPAEAAASALIGSHQDSLLHSVISGVGNGLSAKRKEARPRQESRELGVVAVKVCDEVDEHGM